MVWPPTMIKIAIIITFPTEPGTQEGFHHRQCKHLSHSLSPHTPSMGLCHFCLCRLCPARFFFVFLILYWPLPAWAGTCLQLQAFSGWARASMLCCIARREPEGRQPVKGFIVLFKSLFTFSMVAIDILILSYNLVLDELEWSRELILPPSSSPASKRTLMIMMLRL